MADKKNDTPDSADETPKEAPQATEPDDKKQDIPSDALSRTPDELAEEIAEQGDPVVDEHAGEKKLSPIRRFFRKVNVYFLIFILIVVVAGVITIVSFLNNQKANEEPSIATQGLTEDTLKQLANTDVSVSDTTQTLTIQGNAVIAGQTLMRGNLNVAGNIQSAGALQAPSITISGAANLGEAQINTLQVAQNTAIQGTTTLRDLNVSGTAAFSGPVTASQITVTRLILAGNASLDVPNHISFTGASPGRTINNGVLGNSGSASVNGSDTAGTVNINSGNNPTSGCMVRIEFQQDFTRQPHVTITPVGAAAGNLQFYVDRNNSGFSICSNNAAAANQVFAFDYFVTN